MKTKNVFYTYKHKTIEKALILLDEYTVASTPEGAFCIIDYEKIRKVKKILKDDYVSFFEV